jgi:CheY-like chemotaxis protein
MTDTPKTAIVLEDNEASRFVLRTILEGGGFTVLESVDASDAIAICRTHPERVSVLISDAGLSASGDQDSFSLMQELQPGMSILFVSGYALEQMEGRVMLDSGNRPRSRVNFLQKPFSANQLLRVIGELTADGQAA